MINRNDTSIYTVDGEIGENSTHMLIDCIETDPAPKPNCTLILSTMGGDASHAFRMARYLQNRFARISLLIPGQCKSGGTLVAIGAHELIFTLTGELGPIDTIKYRHDHTARRIDSSQRAFDFLCQKALDQHAIIYESLVRGSVGDMSYNNLVTNSSNIVKILYEPLLRQINPIDLGMSDAELDTVRIYAELLDERAQNLLPGAINKLQYDYPYHGFPIDYHEALNLFKNVRLADDDDLAALARSRSQHPLRVAQGGPDDYAEAELMSDVAA